MENTRQCGLLVFTLLNKSTCGFCNEKEPGWNNTSFNIIVNDTKKAKPPKKYLRDFKREDLNFRFLHQSFQLRFAILWSLNSNAKKTNTSFICPLHQCSQMDWPLSYRRNLHKPAKLHCEVPNLPTWEVRSKPLSPRYIYMCRLERWWSITYIIKHFFLTTWSNI